MCQSISPSGQQGAGTHQVAARVMVESDRHLDQRLQKAPPPATSGAPDVFQDLVSVEETGLVEEGNPAPEGGGGHVSILPQGFILSPEQAYQIILNSIGRP
jgi:hypothetical protein